MPAQTAVPHRLRTAVLTKITSGARSTQVVKRLMQAVSAGSFSHGEKLPAESELSALLGVSVLTVREALDELRSKHIITTTRGREGGSFITATPTAVASYNAGQLLEMSRVALTDLGVHYEAIATSCARYACRRATAEEIAIIATGLQHAKALPAVQWRRQMTELQLAIAALSQSVRLTNEHIRVQADFTPFLALQDSDPKQLTANHEITAQLLDAIAARDAARSQDLISASVSGSTKWLLNFQSKLLSAFPNRQIPADPAILATFTATLNATKEQQ
ncbi:FadR family transcriptional regulator [Leucobacter sp. OH2974_COT-288]|nr:FadR family transcriptional regulator [Leucobacter sp. OH2974_COT-288]